MITVESSAATHLAQKYGYLEYMVERYLQLFGVETEDFLIGNDIPLPKTLRVNTLVTTPQDLTARLRKRGVELEPVEGLPYAFRILQSPIPIGATSEYLQGQYMLQSPASMWAIEALNPQPGQLVIDMCAAPGGKTTLIAQFMENQGGLLATDISRDRMRSLRSNLSRLRVENTLAIRMDAAQLSSIGIQADAVLLDAPCTGEGLIPVETDRHGNVMFGKANIARLLTNKVSEKYKKRTGTSIKIIAKQIGYETRAGSPISFDVVLGSMLGYGAYKFFSENKFGVMVSVTDNFDLKAVPFEELIDPETLKTRLRGVPKGSDFYTLKENLSFRKLNL